MYNSKQYVNLFMEVISMNDKLLTQLRILKMSDSKPNFSELARLYEIDRRTIKKYYGGYEGKPTNRDKPSKLDKYNQLITEKLQIKGTTVRAVYEYIFHEVDSDIGSYSNFNKYLKHKGIKPKKHSKGHPRFETVPRHQAQVDWKEEIKISNRYGEIFTFQVFDYKLGHSRYCHFTYKTTKTRQDVFDCLIASFKTSCEGGIMPSYTKILDDLSDLGIHKMQEYIGHYIEAVNNSEKSFSDSLEELITIEKENNKVRAINAYVKVANFPFIKTMDDFDFSFQPSINKKELMEFTSLGFIEKNEDILFVGTSSVGKTHLATAIGVECARNRYSTYFVSFENLMNQLKKALIENRLEQRMKFFARYKILIIDELGYMPIDSDSANLFFQLIARRYEKHCTIITTNMSFSKWGDVFGSTTLANAVLDRLLLHSSVISIKGPSYRLREKRVFLESQTED